MFPYKKTTIDCGFEFVNNIGSVGLGLVAWCFLVGAGFLGDGGLGVWFLNDLDSCPKQLSLKITFIV